MRTSAKHQTVLPADADSPPDPPPSGDNGDRSRRSPGWLVVTFFLIGFAGSLFVGWMGLPHLLYSEKKQPVDFNHAVHLGLVGDGCNSCHFFRSDGSFSGIPALSRCAGCHQTRKGPTSAEAILIEQYVMKNRQIPWLIYSAQPDYVFFPHAAHVKKAGMPCRQCHGDIGHSTHLPVYAVNRITGYSKDIEGTGIIDSGITNTDRPRYTTMSDCRACHLKTTGSEGACLQCHK